MLRLLRVRFMPSQGDNGFTNNLRLLQSLCKCGRKGMSLCSEIGTCLCLQVHPELQSSFWGSVHAASILQADGLAGSALKLLASCNLLVWEG